MASIQPIDYKLLINNCANCGQEVKELLTVDKADEDARFYFFQLLGNEYLSFYTLSKAIDEANEIEMFWSFLKPKEVIIDDKFKEDRLVNIEGSIRTSVFITTIVFFEATLRAIIPYLNLKVKKNQDPTLSLIISALGDNQLISDQQCSLLKVWVYSRNTMHNMGVHNHSDNRIEYKDKIFYFNKGKALNFLNPDTLVFLIVELVLFWKHFVSQKAIICLPKIEHPVFVQYR